MDTVFPSLFFREPLIHYVSPAVCENLFSSSSGPVIVLNPFDHLASITGLIMGGVGDFFLRWGIYPEAICYSVYMSTDPGDPAGTYVLVAECIPNPEFDVSSYPDGTVFVITAITPEGETPFSEPIEIVKIPAQCPHFDPPIPADLDLEAGEDAVITFVVNEGAGLGQVHYIWLKNGIPILDTTNTTKATLVLTNVTETDDGVYSLQLTNDDPACEVFSADVTLSVKDCPSIVDPQPALNVSVAIGENTTLGPFNVDEADYPLSVIYKWYKDDVLYSDTTATTQASLEFPNPAEADSGEYTLHLTVADSECVEVVSNPITFAVGDCASLPQNIADMLWTVDAPTACASADLLPYGSPPPEQAGNFSLSFSAACYKAGSSNWIELVGDICNPSEVDDITLIVVLQVLAKSGSHSAWTTFQLLTGIDGSAVPPYFDQADFGAEPALNATLSNTVSIPPGIHTITIRVAGDIVGNPDFTMSGTLNTLQA